MTRPPNVPLHWITMALAFCVGCAIVGILQRTVDPTFPAVSSALTLRGEAGAIIRDFAGLHPPGVAP
jgi:hypothetical protein